MTIIANLESEFGIALGSSGSLQVLNSNGEVYDTYKDKKRIFKLTNLSAVILYGAGNIFDTLIEDYVRDFKEQLEQSHLEAYGEFDHEEHLLRDSAQDLLDFLLPKYNKFYTNKPALTLVVAGYCQWGFEEWVIDLSTGDDVLQNPNSNKRYNLNLHGSYLPFVRLSLGYDPSLVTFIQTHVKNPKTLKLLHGEIGKYQQDLPFKNMSLEGIIEYIRFVIETTEKYNKYSQGAFINIPKIQLATITHIDGFQIINKVKGE